MHRTCSHNLTSFKIMMIDGVCRSERTGNGNLCMCGKNLCNAAHRASSSVAIVTGVIALLLVTRALSRVESRYSWDRSVAAWGHRLSDILVTSPPHPQTFTEWTGRACRRMDAGNWTMTSFITYITPQRGVISLCYDPFQRDYDIVWTLLVICNANGNELFYMKAFRKDVWLHAMLICKTWMLSYCLRADFQ